MKQTLITVDGHSKDDRNQCLLLQCTSRILAQILQVNDDGDDVDEDELRLFNQNHYATEREKIMLNM